MSSLFIDHAVGRRLERAEGAASAGIVDTRRRLAPETAAAWRDFDGTYAMFDGVDSPITQTFGLGMFGPVTADGLAEIERFFDERGAATDHEVSPLAGVEPLALLAERGYRPCELSTVLVQPIEPAAGATDDDAAAAATTGATDDAAPPDGPPAAGLTVRLCGDREDERDRWAAMSAAGWGETPEIAAAVTELARMAIRNPHALGFFVEEDGEPIATGSLAIHEGVALLAGASTIPARRGRGAQALLLAARLAEARRRGCELAMMVAAPASTSQRNAERRGFRVAYTRSKWRRSHNFAAGTEASVRP
jgi:GNAT superfamily N-acetyltransferase